MTKCYLDSNVLVYYKNEISSHCIAASKLIENLGGEGVVLCISPLVIDEFIHAFGKEMDVQNRGERFKRIETALNDLSRLPLIEIFNSSITWEGQIKVVKLMEKYELGPRDAYHLLICLENDIDGFATFDKDFRKIFKAKVLERAS